MLAPRQRLSVLVAPWLFVIVFAAIWVGILLPRALEGHFLLIVLCVVAAGAFVSFVLAAVTFSRDVLRGRWP